MIVASYPKRKWFSSVAGLAVAGALGGIAFTSYTAAQDAPESLLPPGFDDPAPAPTPAPQPTVAPPSAPPSGGGDPSSPSGGSSAPLPGGGGASAPSVPSISRDQLSRVPSLEELENLSTDELDDLLGLTPKFDLPPAARRTLSEVGVLSQQEGGMAAASLGKQPASLVRATLAGIDGGFVSRWGHILVRRTLASRLTAPEGMEPIEFATLRAKVLNSMGEFSAARAIVQDIDTGNWDEELTDEAVRAYIATSDFVGACPGLRSQESRRSEDPQWLMLEAICQAYGGETARSNANLDNALAEEVAPEIDIILALRYAGAAGRGRRAAEIDWEAVDTLTPWRFSLANAVGEPVPDSLMESALEGEDVLYFSSAAAGNAMLPMAQRVQFFDRAAVTGVLSSKAMVELFSAIYAQPGASGDAAERADLLRQAYIGGSQSARLGAMRALWGEGDGHDYAGGVMTAYAAARIAPSSDIADQADRLIASMLAAGLDRDAAAWSDVVEPGTSAWAQLALANADAGRASSDAIDAFTGNDYSDEAQRSKFLIAGLAGLGRIESAALQEFSEDLEMDLNRSTKWTQMISRAAEVNNPALVSMLAGLGMQGDNWAQMTPLHLYHLVRSLDQAGLNAEARMIAAEAVARA
ncbi:MAG: hypothetical protein AAGK17_10295 [Pseudomonadota bacterium]